MSDSMHVLVTGASGFLGSAAAMELVRRGHRVRVLARPTSDLGALDGAPVEVALGDILDRPSVEAALVGCDAVLHAAGLARLRDRDRERLVAVNRDGTANVLGAAMDAGVRRAVYLSSAGALGGSERPQPMTEDWASTAETTGVDYFVSKLEAERVARAVGAKGLPLVVLWPGIVLGPGDRLGSSAGTVLRMARGSLPAVVAGGGSYCDVRDVAVAQAVALESAPAGSGYLLGGENLEMEAVAALVARLSGVPAPPKLPYAVMLAGAWLSEVGAALSGGRAAVSRQLVRGAHRYTFMDCSRARRELGYTTRPVEVSVRDTLRWFLARGMLSPTTPELRLLAAEGAPDREPGAAGGAPRGPVLT